MRIVYKKNEIFSAAGDFLSHILITHAHVPILFFSSGGSALQILEHVHTSCMFKDLTLTVLDERAHLTARNFKALTETSFFKKVFSEGARVIEPFLETTVLQDAANIFEEKILTWNECHKDGLMIATFGVGADGHIAGIFPSHDDPTWFNTQYMVPKKYIVGFDAGERNTYPLRLTATPLLICKIRHGTAVVVGNEKQPSLKRLVSDKDIHHTPAILLRDVPDITIYTDQRISA